jgi:hypothetical protein
VIRIRDLNALETARQMPHTGHPSDWMAQVQLLFSLGSLVPNDLLGRISEEECSNWGILL